MWYYNLEDKRGTSWKVKINCLAKKVVKGGEFGWLVRLVFNKKNFYLGHANVLGIKLKDNSKRSDRISTIFFSVFLRHSWKAPMKHI